jgi:hypothetical protein
MMLMEQRAAESSRSVSGLVKGGAGMKVGRLIVTGLAAAGLFLVLDMALGMLGGWIGRRLFGLPEAQPAGIDAKVKLGLVFELINGFLLAVIYAVIHVCLPGDGWVKGVSYGLIVWALRVVMWAFSTYMMTEMAPATIGITVGTGLIECLILGVVIAVLYGTGTQV